MFQFFVKNRGSITIFLSIILLPCLTFTGLLVDMANYTLSKSLVESAGNMATNAALANYDTVLEDVYGLFAMSQREDNPQAALQDNLERYFTDSLMASGLLERDAKDFSSELLGTLYDSLYNSDGDVTESFIHTYVDNFQATYAENSNLTNPEIMKNQIVEFMKYRGPAEAGLSLLDTFSALKQTNAKTPVASDKMEVDKAIGNMAEAAQALFFEIRDYYDPITLRYKKAEKDFYEEGAQAKMKKVNKEILMHLVFPYEDLDELVFASDNPEPGNTEVTDSADCTTKLNGITNAEGIQDKITRLKTHASKIDQYLSTSGTNMYQMKETFTLYADVYTNYVAKLRALLVGATESKEDYDNKISSYQAKWDELNSTINTKTSEANSYAAQINELDNTSPAPLDYAIKRAALVISENSARSAASSAQTSLTQLEADKVVWDRETLALGGLINQIQGLIDASNTDYSNKVREAKGTYSSQMLTAKTNAESELSKAGPLLAELYNSACYDIVTLASKAKATQTMIEEVVTKNEEFGQTISTYNSNLSENGSAQDDYSSTMQSNQQKTADIYNPEDLNVMLDQILACSNYMSTDDEYTGVRSIFELGEETRSSMGARDTILYYWTWYSEELYSLPAECAALSYSEYIDETTTSTTTLSDQLLTELITKVEITLESDFAGNSNLVIDSAKADDYYNLYADLPDNSVLNRTDYSVFPSATCYTKRMAEAGVRVAGSTETINVPQYYMYLVTTYGYEDPTGAGVDEEFEKSAQAQSDDAAGETKESEDDNLANYKKDEVFIESPSDGGENGAETPDGEVSYDSDDAGSGQFGSMAGMLSDMVGILNDAVEGMRDNIFITEYIMCNFSTYADTFDKNAGSTNQGTDSGSGSEKKTRQTMTNFPIDKNNNVLYGFEAEYMLYGDKDNPKNNVLYAELQIYAIRMVFNSIYALTDADINNWTRPPALAVQAASQGLIPYQLVQVIMKLALAIAESALDLSNIMEGEKVPLYKTRDTWQCSPTGIKDEFVEKAKTVAGELASEAISTLSKCAISEIQEFIDNGTELAINDMEQLKDDIDTEVKNAVGGGLTDAINSLTAIITDKIESAYMEIYTSGVEYQRAELESKIRGEMTKLIDTFENDTVKSFLQEKSEGLMTDILDSVDSELTTASDGMVAAATGAVEDAAAAIDASAFVTLVNKASTKAVETVENMTEAIESKANELITTAGAKASAWIEEEGGKLADNAAEQVTNGINGLLDNCFPASTETIKTDNDTKVTSNSKISAILSFGYQDYLNLFMFLGLCMNGDPILVRTADIIQVNIRHGMTMSAGSITKSYDAYEKFNISNAYTYVEINSDVSIDPLLLSQRMFQDGIGSDISLFSYKYQTIAGY